jgi:hypothetical protein
VILSHGARPVRLGDVGPGAVRLSILALFIFTWPILAAAQSAVASNQEASLGYLNTKLGFGYTPPPGMIDSTAQAVRDLKARAARRHTQNTLDILLSMTSGPDDIDPAWHSIAVETYPRNAMANLDDAAAELKMSGWVAGRRALDPGKRLTLAGRQFTLCEFEQPDIGTTKYAAIYTTVRKGKLVSFALGANSPSQLKMLKNSMKTVKFF